MLVVAATAVAGCGGGSHYANQPRPPQPVNLTVYINDQRVSVSPASVGAGPVQLIVTNQASNSESLSVLRAGATAAQSLADTGPISPQGTAQVTVNLNSPGTYTVGISPKPSTQASAATPTGIQAAVLHVGRHRPSASSQLLQP
jgi:phage tail sheath gpL-like